MTRHVLLAASLLLLQAVAATTASDHLDPANGNDQMTGLSPEAAWKSLAKVRGVVEKPGLEQSRAFPKTDPIALKGLS